MILIPKTKDKKVDKLMSIALNFGLIISQLKEIYVFYDR